MVAATWWQADAASFQSLTCNGCRVFGVSSTWPGLPLLRPRNLLQDAAEKLAHRFKGLRAAETVARAFDRDERHVHTGFLHAAAVALQFTSAEVARDADGTLFASDEAKPSRGVVLALGGDAVASETPATPAPHGERRR